ncbi:hypothetical protein F2P81_003641 [Scophthalmus maximus]|uniref:Uncharacterized protein n=1 Tax=Scophthalmus maximus TaxID=52904 RepID=A0A6A4TER2_SCOMX|nr:hypothetical protein F2P81_003641 [Scophthalmus maximus]
MAAAMQRKKTQRPLTMNESISHQGYDNTKSPQRKGPTQPLNPPRLLTPCSSITLSPRCSASPPSSQPACLCVEPEVQDKVPALGSLTRKKGAKCEYRFGLMIGTFKVHNFGSFSFLTTNGDLQHFSINIGGQTKIRLPEPSVSNAMFDNHHVNISQLGAGEFSVIDQCDSVGSFPFHSYSSETGVRVYSRSITSTGHRPDRFGVIPSQQRYRLRRWQRLIRNILMTMSDSVILLSQHPD